STDPRVLAIGETHAQKDSAAPSSTKRFTEKLLPMIAPKTSDLVVELWVGNPACQKKVKEVAQRQKPVTENQAPTDQNEFVAHGGGMHNDVTPRAGRETWSFGARIASATSNRYVELDLIVPEAIKDTDAWRSQPWYAAYDPKAQAPGETLLVFVAPGSYALV